MPGDEAAIVNMSALAELVPRPMAATLVKSAAATKRDFLIGCNRLRTSRPYGLPYDFNSSIDELQCTYGYNITVIYVEIPFIV